MADLTEDQLAQVKAALQQRYLELREEIRDELERSGNEHYADLAGSVADPGDDSVADMLVDVDAALVDRQVHEIREVEAALKRMADLDFGDCVDCGGEIGFERLMAYPTARRCVRCQSLIHMSRILRSDPGLRDSNRHIRW
jgi:DnaK suppressor protein